ncbi:hypothetical protein D3C72_2552010 [compost metagenome]
MSLSNVDSYDAERKIVLFNQGEQFATVSESNEARLKKHLAGRKKDSSQKENNDSNNKQ